MKLTKVVSIVFLLVLLVSSANAFDCERKGFVIGLGAGIAPWVHGSWGDPAMDYDKFQAGVNFLGGYAWDNQNMILLIMDYTSYDDSVTIVREGGSLYQNEMFIGQAFVGFGYSHYFSPQPRSFYFTVGLGTMAWVPSESFYQSCHKGRGFLLGGGYELTQHLQLYGSFTIGRASRDGNDYTHSNLIFTLTGVLY